MNYVDLWGLIKSESDSSGTTDNLSEGFNVAWSSTYGTHNIYKPIKTVNTGNKVTDYILGTLAGSLNILGAGLNVISNGIGASLELQEIGIDFLDQNIPSYLTASGSFKQDLDAFVFIGISNPALLSNLGNTINESVNYTVQSLNQTKNYVYYKKLVNKLDVSTECNTVTFYSGPGNRQKAEKFASMNGKTTLEMTNGGKILDNMKLFEEGSPVSTKQARKLWETLSAKYATGASGNTYAFIEGANPNSIFNTVENSALLKNQNVTNIFSELMKKGKK